MDAKAQDPSGEKRRLPKKKKHPPMGGLSRNVPLLFCPSTLYTNIPTTLYYIPRTPTLRAGPAPSCQRRGESLSSFSFPPARNGLRIGLSGCLGGCVGSRPGAPRPGSGRHRGLRLAVRVGVGVVQARAVRAWSVEPRRESTQGVPSIDPQCLLPILYIGTPCVDSLAQRTSC
jgi:hypothetical protein